MIAEIQKQLSKLGKTKVEFDPQIKFKTDGAARNYWIDNIYKVKDTIMVTMSTVDDDFRKNLSDCTPQQQKAIHTRLNSLQIVHPHSITPKNKML